MEDYRKIAIELGRTLISKAPETREDVERMLPELKESEDERISKHLLYHFRNKTKKEWNGMPVKDIIAYLEEQEQHKKFRDSIQVGDKVTKNEDGVLVNLSQLNRFAKNYKRQGEQKPADKVEPKFKIGDWVVRNGKTLQISGIDTVLDGTFHYWFTKGTWLSSKKMENAMLWTIQDAKEGDVLVASDGSIFILKDTIDGVCKHYVALTTYDVVKFNEGLEHYWETTSSVHPATKEQREKLEKAMADVGYTFDFEKKELKKIEQKPAWSDEDETIFVNLVAFLEGLCGTPKGGTKTYAEWLKERYKYALPMPHWKQSDEQIECLSKHIEYERRWNSSHALNVLSELLEQLKKLK